MNNADIAMIKDLIPILPIDEYDLEIDNILKEIRKLEKINVFDLKEIIYRVFVDCLDESTIYEKKNKIYNDVAIKIYNVIRRDL
jgi:hypothetical protein